MIWDGSGEWAIQKAIPGASTSPLWGGRIAKRGGWGPARSAAQFPRHTPTPPGSLALVTLPIKGREWARYTSTGCARMPAALKMWR